MVSNLPQRGTQADSSSHWPLPKLQGLGELQTQGFSRQLAFFCLGVQRISMDRMEPITNTSSTLTYNYILGCVPKETALS